MNKIIILSILSFAVSVSARNPGNSLSCTSNTSKVVSCLTKNFANDNDFITAVLVCRSGDNYVMHLQGPNGESIPDIPALKDARTGATSYTADVSEDFSDLKVKLVVSSNPRNSELIVPPEEGQVEESKIKMFCTR